MGKVMHVFASFVPDAVCRRQGASEGDAGPMIRLYFQMRVLQEVLSAGLALGAMARILGGPARSVLKMAAAETPPKQALGDLAVVEAVAKVDRTAHDAPVRPIARDGF